MAVGLRHPAKMGGGKDRRFADCGGKMVPQPGIGAPPIQLDAKFKGGH